MNTYYLNFILQIDFFSAFWGIYLYPRTCRFQCCTTTITQLDRQVEEAAVPGNVFHYYPFSRL